MTKQRYQLQKRGNLLLLNAAIGKSDGTAHKIRLLLDTGSSYTVLNSHLLESLGYDLQVSQQVSVFAANGKVDAPIIVASWLNLLGQRLKSYSIVAHALPTGVFVDGLLGIDLLTHLEAVIDIPKAEIMTESEPRNQKSQG